MLQDLKTNFFKYNIPKNLEGERVKFALYNDKEKRFAFSTIVSSAKDAILINYKELAPHFQYKYKLQIMKQNKWENHTKYKYIKVDFEDENAIKYRLFLNPDSEYLMVGFQGNGLKPSYNYTGSLAELEVNRLYILDDYTDETPNNGAYYLGENRILNYMDNVHSLIEKIRVRLGILKNNVICFGTSKGGFAAILYSLKFNYPNCVVGSPTIYLGNSLILENSSTRVYADFISGGRKEDDIEWLNNLIPNSIDFSKTCTIKILIGRGERRYKNHILPFVKSLEEDPNINVCLDVKDFEQHSLIGSLFPPFAINQVKSIIS